MAVMKKETGGGQSEEQRQAQMTRLLQAIRRGDLVVASSMCTSAPALLTDRDASGEIENEGGWWTPLGLAARLGHTDIVRLLVSKGADTERDCAGYTGRDTSRKDVCEFGARYTPAHLAAHGRHARVLRVLLEGGAKAGALDEYGDTPLYVAARQLSPECVQVLVELGGSLVGLDKVNSEDETPMMAAVMALHKAKTRELPRALRTVSASASAVIARLLEAGCDPNDASTISAVDGLKVKYSTALLCALDAGLEDLVLLLHLHGAQLPAVGL